MAMKVEVKGKQLVLTIDLQDPAPSATGKTLVVASSHGNQETEARVNGKPVIVGFNAYVRKEKARPPDARDNPEARRSAHPRLVG